jgi:hypothetical protein
MSQPVDAPEHAAHVPGATPGAHTPAEAPVPAHGHASEHAHPAPAMPGVPFSERQIDQFDADDSNAGRAIGKMLATFFLYTVIVMALVSWWTLTR